jgi:hypothetical protein
VRVVGSRLRKLSRASNTRSPTSRRPSTLPIWTRGRGVRCSGDVQPLGRQPVAADLPRHGIPRDQGVAPPIAGLVPGPQFAWAPASFVLDEDAGAQGSTVAASLAGKGCAGGHDTHCARNCPTPGSNAKTAPRCRSHRLSGKRHARRGTWVNLVARRLAPLSPSRGIPGGTERVTTASLGESWGTAPGCGGNAWGQCHRHQESPKLDDDQPPALGGRCARVALEIMLVAADLLARLRPPPVDQRT